MSLVLLDKNKKFEHHIQMKIYKLIVLRFWIRNGVNTLFGLSSGLIGVVYLSSNFSL